MYSVKGDAFFRSKKHVTILVYTFRLPNSPCSLFLGFWPTRTCECEVKALKCFFFRASGIFQDGRTFFTKSFFFRYALLCRGWILILLFILVMEQFRSFVTNRLEFQTVHIMCNKHICRRKGLTIGNKVLIFYLC